MNIETRFQINQLVKHKFCISPDKISALEILYIITETCSAGTQVFYQCRPILAEPEMFFNKKDGKEPNWTVAISYGHDHHDQGWRKFREDELTELPPDHLEIITSGLNKPTQK